MYRVNFSIEIKPGIKTQGKNSTCFQNHIKIMPYAKYMFGGALFETRSGYDLNTKASLAVFVKSLFLVVMRQHFNFISFSLFKGEYIRLLASNWKFLCQYFYNYPLPVCLEFFYVNLPFYSLKKNFSYI